MSQLGAIRVCPVVLTGMAVNESPWGDQCFCKMGVEWQSVFVVSEFKVPRVEPMFVSIPEPVAQTMLAVNCAKHRSRRLPWRLDLTIR